MVTGVTLMLLCFDCVINMNFRIFSFVLLALFIVCIYILYMLRLILYSKVSLGETKIKRKTFPSNFVVVFQERWMLQIISKILRNSPFEYNNNSMASNRDLDACVHKQNFVWMWNMAKGNSNHKYFCFKIQIVLTIFELDWCDDDVVICLH